MINSHLLYRLSYRGSFNGANFRRQQASGQVGRMQTGQENSIRTICSFTERTSPRWIQAICSSVIGRSIQRCQTMMTSTHQFVVVA